MDLMTIEQCASAGAMIDSLLKQGRIHLVLRFADSIRVSGSFTGFLMERVREVKQKNGQIIIVVSNREIQQLLEEFSIHKLVPVYATLRAFSLSADCRFPIPAELDNAKVPLVGEPTPEKHAKKDAKKSTVAKADPGNSLLLDGNNLGALDVQDRILATLSSAIRDSLAHIVILDISQLDSIFSKGIRAIVSLHKQCKEQSRQFVVTYAKGSAWTMLRSQRLDARIHFREKPGNSATGDYVDSPFGHMLEKGTRLFHPQCPECRKDDLVYNHDRGFKWLRRLMVLNNRFVCARCRITWRRKRPDAFLDFVTMNSRIKK